eukprot:scaffold9098_cov124-Isochrysis_galbana.AAC.10
MGDEWERGGGVTGRYWTEVSRRVAASHVVLERSPSPGVRLRFLVAVRSERVALALRFRSDHLVASHAVPEFPLTRSDVWTCRRVPCVKARLRCGRGQ